MCLSLCGETNFGTFDTAIFSCIKIFMLFKPYDLKIYTMSQPKVNFFFTIIAVVLAAAAGAQNINGEKVVVGKESITIINFPDKVLNINFSDDAAYDYYIPKRREERSISIQFNKEKDNAPNTGLLVNEGGRSHMFRLIFDSAYNINDDTRPPLWYDHSNLKELKAFVQKQKEDAGKPKDEAAEKKETEEAQKKEAEKRKAEYAEAQQQREKELEEKAKLADQQRKQDEAKQKEQAANIAKAKKEADEKEKQLKLAAEKEAQEKKAAELKAEKDAADLAKQKAAEEQQLRQLKELQDKKDRKAAEALEKAQKAAEEKKRLLEEQRAKQKALDEEKRIKAAAETTRKEAERQSAQERLAKLEAERKEREANRAYSEVGLWQRYGKKGINVYDVPPGHMGTVISDFYIAKDTLRHFLVADSVMKNDTKDKLNIEAAPPANKQVKITLENIVFKDVYSYYKLKIENNSDEDFLMGKTYMYWYDVAEKPIKMIKSSYITYVTSFPLVRPHTSQYAVFTTRSPNVAPGESLVLFIDERRKDMGTASIVISSTAYDHELKKAQHDVKSPAGDPPATKDDNVGKKGKKKNRKS